MERLLRVQHPHLLVAVHRALGGLEVLTSSLKRSCRLNALVAQRHLRGPIQLRLRRLKRTLVGSLLRLERLRPDTLARLELTLGCVFARRELLLRLLQGELVLLTRIELAGLIDRALVGQRLVAVRLRVGLRDWRDPVDHRGLRGADGHGAVDQAPLVHLLQRHRAGALHQRVVLRQQGLDLPGRRLGGTVNLARLRIECGRLLDQPLARRRCRRGSLDVERVVGNHRGHIKSSNDKGPHVRAPVDQTRDGVGRRGL